MSRISDVSNKLGQYLLQGYILTDDPCPTCSIPMLRTPAAHARQPQRLFCSQCSDPVSEAAEAEHHSTDNNADKNVLDGRVSQVSSQSEFPTLAQPPDNSEILHRRLQSDKASAEIGNRMLKGWAMLAEECPNESCYGIPLVRSPNSGAVKDKRMECVVCGSIYVHERTAGGQAILMKQNQVSTATTTPEALKSVGTNVLPSSFEDNRKASHEISLNSQHSTDKIPRDALTAGQHALANEKVPLISTISATIVALQDSLQVLSTRLSSVASNSPPDHLLIGELAHSIGQISSTLEVILTLYTQQKKQL